MDFEVLEFWQSRVWNLTLSIPIYGFCGFRKILVLNPRLLASYGVKR